MKKHTNRVQIKELYIGNDSPILVQTMCNTHTQDVEASVAQCLKVGAAGAKSTRQPLS